MRASHELALTAAALPIILWAPALVGFAVAVALAFSYCAHLEREELDARELSDGR